MADGFLSDALLLAIWERGLGQNTHQRALDLLAEAYPTHDAALLAALPLGQRDRLLLRVRQSVFGNQMQARAACPSCGEALEVEHALSDFLAVGAEDDSVDVWTGFVWGAWRGAFRPPTTADMLAIAALGDAGAARQVLIQRCVEAQRDDEASGAALPDDMVAHLIAEMSALDPLGDIQLVMHCPFCACRWNSRLDIAVYLWAEISAEAQILLQEVHQLASAYHWHERDLLAMSRQRRRYYLGLVHGE